MDAVEEWLELSRLDGALEAEGVGGVAEPAAFGFAVACVVVLAAGGDLVREVAGTRWGEGGAVDHAASSGSADEVLGEGRALGVGIECSAGLSRGEQVACALELFVEFEFEPGSFDFSAGLGDGEVERLSPGAERAQEFALGGALPPGWAGCAPRTSGSGGRARVPAARADARRRASFGRSL